MDDSESSEKHMFGMNCLSTGNTLYIKVDTVTLIKKQFDKFMERLNNREKSYYDMNLPFFIIESFSTLFKHWIEITDLQELISANVFEKIFKEMAQVFSLKVEESQPETANTVLSHQSVDQVQCPKTTDVTLDSQSDDQINQQSSLPTDKPMNNLSGVPMIGDLNKLDNAFKLFCKECKERVIILNEDPQLSYDLHVQSEEHQRYVDNPKVTIIAENGQLFRKTDSGREPINAEDRSLSFDLLVKNEELQKCHDASEDTVVVENGRSSSETSNVICVNGDDTSSEQNLDQNSTDDSVKPKPKIPSLFDFPVNLKEEKYELPVPQSLRSVSTGSKGKKYKPPELEDEFCLPCCKNALDIADHKMSPVHQRQEQFYVKSQNLLKIHSRYITIGSKKNFTFSCSLCKVSQSGTNCFIQHCESKTHLKNCTTEKK